MREKLLFICSQNRWRSPTAEALFLRSQFYDARSAGTSPMAKVRVTAGHIRWADRMFVMEKRHRELLKQRFNSELGGQPLFILDIPDEYRFMDQELIDILRVRLSAHLENIPGQS